MSEPFEIPTELTGGRIKRFAVVVLFTIIGILILLGSGGLMLTVIGVFFILASLYGLYCCLPGKFALVIDERGLHENNLLNPRTFYWQEILGFKVIEGEYLQLKAKYIKVDVNFTRGGPGSRTSGFSKKNVDDALLNSYGMNRDELVSRLNLTLEKMK